MKEKLFIANFLVYKTPGEEAKGEFSVGLSIASRLNGNGLLVGTYNPGANEENSRKVGFITFREKFTSKEEANAFKAKYINSYRLGSALNIKEWAWGEIDEENTLALNSPGAVVHFIEFIGHEAEVKVQAEREMRYEGKVVEPIEA